MGRATKSAATGPKDQFDSKQGKTKSGTHGPGAVERFSPGEKDYDTVAPRLRPGWRMNEGDDESQIEFRKKVQKA